MCAVSAPVRKQDEGQELGQNSDASVHDPGQVVQASTFLVQQIFVLELLLLFRSLIAAFHARYLSGYVSL